MSNIHSHAKREFDILSKLATDPNDRPIIEEFREEILALCEKFGNSGQSGGSAPYTANAISQAIKKLCLFEPITPITGFDEEWVNVSEYGNKTDSTLYQNNRESGIFKENGKAHYLDAIVWKDTKGHTWGGSALLPDGRRVMGSAEIKDFPFTPKTFYIDINDVEVAPDDWEFYIKDESQLDAVNKYYNLRYKPLDKGQSN